MKKFLVFLSLIGVLGIVLACGILAENESSNGNGESSVQTESDSSEESTVSIESIIATVSVEASSDQTSNTDSAVSSKRYGAGATDPTGSVAGEFSDPVNDSSTDILSENTSSVPATTGKRIFNLSKLLTILLIIPVALAIGAVAALIHVNKKSFLNDDGKKNKKNKNIRKKK